MSRHLLLLVAAVCFVAAGALVAPAVALVVAGACLAGAWQLLAPVGDE